MAILSRIAQSTGALLSGLHPRENFRAVGSLGALNAEVVLWNVDGCQSANIDLAGTFNLTIEVSGTTDGTDWQVIPVSPKDATGSRAFVATVAGTTQQVLECDFSGFVAIRVRCTSFISGSALVTIVASLAPLPVNTPRMAVTTNNAATIVGAAGAAVTLTLTAPPTGLRHYITGIQIDRFAAAALTAAATPVTVTTTNLPGSLAFTLPADAALQGTEYSWSKDFDARPLASVTQGLSTTIVCPATTSVIWRVTAYFFLAP